LETQDLKKVGLKATLPRLRILQILEESDQKHLSAEDVYKALLEMHEDVGLATVYRVLTQFEAAGLVIRHHFDSGHSVFELNTGGHHDHMICLKTGRKLNGYKKKSLKSMDISWKNTAWYCMSRRRMRMREYFMGSGFSLIS